MKARLRANDNQSVNRHFFGQKRDLTGTESATPRGMKITFPSLAAAIALTGSASADLVVTPTGSEPTGPAIKIVQASKDAQSATTARFKTNKAAAESNRDFGQTFTTGADGFFLDRITLKLATQPVAPSVFGANVSVQLFEVSGRATINNNGTETGKVAPWSDDPRVDDFLEGETYTSLGVARGGMLPAFMVPGQHLVLNFRKADRQKLKPNTQYGFLFMFDEGGADRGLSFVTSYWSAYEGGHAIRREGEVPPDMTKRALGLPTTKAGTKSDVHSDIVFWVEGSDIASASGAVATVEPAMSDPALPLPSR